MRPGRNKSGKVVEPCGVGVGVRGDIESLRSGGIDLRNDFRHAPPARFAADLQMPDFDRDMGLAADAQGLVEGRQNAGAFVAHVGGVNAAELGSFPRESDQLTRFGVRSRSVFERSRDANCAIAHCLAHELFHLLELCGSGLDVVVAEHHAPDARGAYVAGDVDSDALLFETRKVFAKRPPVGANVIVIVLLLISAENGVVQRGNRFALAGDFRGDPLIDLGGHRGSTRMVYSDCPSMSMKPGATTMPPASMVRARGASLRLPMEDIFPSRIPISPEYQGEPVPSMMRPLVMTMSKDSAGSREPRGATPMSKTADKNTDFQP